MDKRFKNNQSQSIFSKGQKANLNSPKQSGLILPMIKDSKDLSNSARISFLQEEAKIFSEAQKKKSQLNWASLSPRINDLPNKEGTFSDWSKSLKNDKPIIQTEVQLRRASFLYSKLHSLLQEIDSLDLPAEVKKNFSSMASVAEVEEKFLKISQKNWKFDQPSKDENDSAVYDIENKGQISLIKSNSIRDQFADTVSISYDVTKGEITIEEYNKVKEELDELNKKYEKLSELYKNDTNSLNKDIEKIEKDCYMKEGNYECTLAKYNALVAKHENCQRIVEEMEKKHMADIEEYKAQVREALEQMQEKHLELIQTNQYIQKTRNYKKDKEEVIRELYEKIDHLSQINDMCKTEIYSLKSSLKANQDSLDKERQKTIPLEEKLKTMELLKSQNKDLEIKLAQALRDLEFTASNYKQLQLSYSKYQEKASSTESSLKNMVEKLQAALNTSTNSNNVSERQRVRRMSIVNQNIEVSSNEVAMRLLKKISTLEEVVTNSQVEIEKTTKDLVYSKKVIEEKNLLISQMEKKIKSEVSTRESEVKRRFIKDLEAFLKKYKKPKTQLTPIPSMNYEGKTLLAFEEKSSDYKIPTRDFDFDIIKTLIHEFKSNYLTNEEFKSIN
ncbi:hypothetical protein SteCoe_17522 [Stentor coeruleus]|uniref:Uncharacterized protein n=1 Tax=Stentor coeruleus TaxID=5963 RepID=A0A1R2BYZ0_9CILI|nr:hypothetical protein SteCoe_17522 [Stentor coeruleus]